MSRTLFRLSTPLLLLPALIPSPCASAQDVVCAVGAPAGDVQPATEKESENRADMRRLATGAGVKVAVIDTGVARHPQLNQLVGGADFVTPDAPEPLLDCDAHGTVVAGIIAGTETGIAPDAQIMSIRQSSAHYRTPTPREGDEDAPPAAGNLETLTQAIHNALDEKAKVINISVVSCVEPTLASRVDTRGITEALNRAEHEGAVVVAAAGNLTHECPAGSTVYPAHFPTVLTVGARSDAHTMADYSLPVPEGTTLLSARGDVPRALAPGNKGWSAGIAGERGAVEPFAGTSFAAPVVSGTAALLRQRYPHASAGEIRDIITTSSEPHGGAVDPLRALTFIEHAQNPDSDPLQVKPAETVRSAAPARGQWIAVNTVLLGALAIAAAALRGILSMSRSTRPRG